MEDTQNMFIVALLNVLYIGNMLLSWLIGNFTHGTMFNQMPTRASIFDAIIQKGLCTCA